MTTVTLEDVKSELARLTEKVASIEAQAKLATSFPIEVAFPQLNAGEKWVGVVISADGKKREHIILLPGEKESINWKGAMEWAKSIGGELPDRTEGALLFATMKDEFEEAAYWTREQYASDSGYAWYQNFLYGGQNYYDTSYKRRARAVRRLPI